MAIFCLRTLSYINFLTNTHTDVGGQISSSLLEVLVETVKPLFKVGNIEGDAIFIYEPDDGSASGQTVLDAVDSLYCAFSDRVCALRYGASCPTDPALLASALARRAFRRICIQSNWGSRRTFGRRCHRPAPPLKKM
jgi:hypothetical protein